MTRTKRDLKDALPRYYDDFPEVDAIMKGASVQVDKSRQKAREITDQFYVRTAGEIGLAAWERVLDLPPRPNSSINFRRNRILARLNGTAPATVKYLTDVVNSHVSDKSAKIVEHNEDYHFEAEIPVDNPIDTAAIRRDMDEVKPAHLSFGITGVHYGGSIIVDRDYYEFDVPYRPTNTFNTDIMDGRKSEVFLKLDVNDYNFDVSLPVTNILQTDSVNGFIGSGGLAAVSEIKYMTIEHPVCGAFYPMEGVV